MMALYSVVVTPAEDRTLVSLADLREQLSIRSNDTALDEWLQKVILRVSGQAERYCKRIFSVQTYRDSFVPPQYVNADELLRLAQSPVIDDPAVAVTADGQVIDPTGYSIDYLAGFLSRINATWSGNSLTVDYTAGFTETPPDVQQAVLELAVMEFRGRGRDPMLRERESPGLGRESFWVGAPPGGSSIPQDIAGLLNPYRRGFNG